MTPPPPSRETQVEGGRSARLAVLNPWGGDPNQAYPHGAGQPGEGVHPPVNYHAYAACTRGGFYRDPSAIIDPGEQTVLLLLRRDLKTALKALAALRLRGKTVAISLKESGAHQVAALLADPKRLALFREICAEADYALSSTPDLLPLYRGAGAREAIFIPTPYPVDVPAWDFSRPIEERRGIFVGTREFEVPSRNHLAALLALRGLDAPVTVINADGRKGRRILESLGYRGDRLRVVEGRMNYPDYLRLMAGHRLVFQLDRSAVPGQVAGDALLCRVPCVGGDGAVERLAFPSLTGFGRDTSALLEAAAALLSDEAAYAAALAEAERLGGECLSFSLTADRLRVR